MKIYIDKYAIIETAGKRKVVRLCFAQRRRHRVYGIFETKQEAREAIK